jgi:hypothetical protein
MFDTSNPVPRSEGSISRLLRKLRRKTINFAAGDIHSAFVPWSDYNRTEAGKKVKKAVTGLIPSRPLTIIGKQYRPMSETDPDTGQVTIRTEDPVFKEMINEKGEYYNYPIHSKGRERYNTRNYMRARYETETAPLAARLEGLKHGSGTLGKSESDVLKDIEDIKTGIKGTRRKTFSEWKQEAERRIQTEAGGQKRLGVSELAHHTRRVIREEMARHRRYMAAEVGAVINPHAAPGQRFRSTGARAIIKARGVNPALARAYPEQLSEYNRRLGSLVGRQQEQAGSILTHGEKHLHDWIARGMSRSGDFQNAAPEEISRKARELGSYISHPEPSMRHYFIPDEQKGKLVRYLTHGHPQGRKVTVADVDRIKLRADTLLQRSSNQAAARVQVLKGGKIFDAPLIRQVKGYPYLKKAGIVGGIIGGAGILGALALRKRKSRETQMTSKQLLHRFEVDPEVAERILQNVSMDLWKSHKSEAMAVMGKVVHPPKLTWPSEQRIGAIKTIRHLIDRGIIHPESAAQLVQPTEYIKNPQLTLPGFHSHELIPAQKFPIPSMRDKMQEAELKAAKMGRENVELVKQMRETDEAITSERAAREPSVKQAYQTGHKIGHKAGRSEGAGYAKQQHEVAIGKLKQAQKSELSRKTGRLKWAAAGALGVGAGGGYLIGRQHRSNQFHGKHKLIQFKSPWDSPDTKDKHPEISGEDPQWLKDIARKTLYGKNYSTRGQAQSIKKWGGRTHRLLRDIGIKSQGKPNLDVRGRPRKSEWERPWVSGALTTAGIVGSIYGAKKGIEFIRNRPLESRIGQLREGFLRAEYSKKVPGLQKVGQFFQGVKSDIRRMVDKPVAKPKYKFSTVDPKTGKPKSQERLAREREKADNLSTLRSIAEGRKKHPDETFSNKGRVIRFDEPKRRATKKEKEKYWLEGAGSIGIAGLLALLAKRRGGVPPTGGVHIHNYPPGGAPQFTQHIEPVKPRFFHAFKEKQTDDDATGETGIGHDVITGAVEGGLAYPASEWAYRKLIGKGTPTFGKKALVGGVVGGLATGLVGISVANILRAQRKARERVQQQLKSKVKLIQFRQRDQVVPQRTLVTKSRYLQQVRQQDYNAANRHYIQSALIGGGIGLALRKNPTRYSKAILTGAGLGVGTQAAVRAYGAPREGPFGERSWGQKRAEKAVPVVGGAILAGKLIGKERLKDLFKFSAKNKTILKEIRFERGKQIRKVAPYINPNAFKEGKILGKLSPKTKHIWSESYPGREIKLKRMAYKANKFWEGHVENWINSMSKHPNSPLGWLKKMSSRLKEIRFDSQDKAGLIATGAGTAGFLTGGLYRGRKVVPGEDLTGRRVIRSHSVFPFMQHEAVGAGPDHVVDVYHRPEMGKKGVIRLVPVGQFAQGKPVSIMGWHNPMAKIRAKSRVGETIPYSLLRRNCQLFGDECRGAARVTRNIIPRQVRTAVTVGGLSAGGAYGLTKKAGQKHQFATNDDNVDWDKLYNQAQVAGRHASKWGGAATAVGGVGASALGATFLPGALDILKIPARRLARKAQASVARAPLLRSVIRAPKKDPFAAGKTVHDYIEGSQKILNTGAHGRLIGQALQSALANPTGFAGRQLRGRIGMDEWGLKHWAKFRSGRLPALYHWDKEYKDLITRRSVPHQEGAGWGKILPGTPPAAHAKQLQRYREGRRATFKEYRDLTEEKGLSHSEAFQHITTKSSDPKIRNYMAALVSEKQKPIKHYAKAALIAPGLVAGGSAAEIGGYELYKRNKEQ